ncbi:MULTISPECIES: SdpI family protein [Streptomyces]|uniref:hypothetical protein n=1 Tax=Streptomyces TaxID=1883 RepID=UPI0005F8C5B1|nr:MULTISPECIES: hypothetical protein [Streptomyces]KJY17538.1 hypothetical protein VR43_29215 [Streptomyces sp. NRRL S-104]KOU73560.1 hypothetical protein ADK61_23135 [Streptomyces sp. XY66]
MKGGRGRGLAGWAAGIPVVLVALPMAARGRLPDPLATHWGGPDGAPDGAMSFGGSMAFPAAIWAVLVLGVAVFAAARAWAATALLPAGVALAGAQAVIVRANLDREDWRQAELPTAWVAVAVCAAAVLAALAGMLIDRRAPGRARGGGGPADRGPVMDVPAGERLVWLARTSNPWLGLTAGALGAAAAAGAVLGVGGLVAGPAWLVAALALGLAALAVLACSSVRARVTGEGLEVAFGPLGWPVRRWPAAAVESARVEDRRPVQVGGWGYRLSGLGTTVMLRAGECLVVRAGGRDFAVSVDDAARGAALLNSLARCGGGGGGVERP